MKVSIRDGRSLAVVLGGAAGLAGAKPVNAPRAMGIATMPVVITNLAEPTTSGVDYSNVLLKSALSAQECFDTSLTRPAWDITGLVFTVVDYNMGGRKGDVKFSVFNAAVNQTRNCHAENIDLEGTDGNWYACSEPDTNFQFVIGPNDINIKGTWNCGGSPGVTFIGSGTIETAQVLVCDDFPNRPRGWETVCRMSASYVSAALTSPVAIHPEQPQPPPVPAYRSTRCDDKSENPSWRIDNAVYTKATAKDAQSELVFNVTNLSNNEQVVCYTKVDDMAAGSPKHMASWVDCASPAPAEGDEKESIILSTKAMFDPEYNLFGIQQEWKCNDPFVYVDSPTQWAGTGFLVKPLTCAEPAEGETAVKCTLPKSTIDGYKKAPAMPHTSYSRSCTLNSINTTSLSLTSYKLDKSADAGLVGAFTLHNLGSGDSYSLSSVAVVDDGEWHACASSTTALPWQLVDCQYSLDASHEKLGFKIQWYCDDRDPNHAILFKAEAAAELPKDTTATVDLAISSLTWASSNKPMENGPLLPWV